MQSSVRLGVSRSDMDADLFIERCGAGWGWGVIEVFSLMLAVTSGNKSRNILEFSLVRGTVTGDFLFSGVTVGTCGADTGSAQVSILAMRSPPC